MVTTTLIGLLLPATAAVIYAIYRPLWAGTASASGAATYKAITIRTVAFVMALYALVLAVLFDMPGARLVAPRATIVLFGLLCVAVGDLLPRTRPNLFVGIRTVRTLEDRELWVHFHRVCGYAAVGFGLATMIAGAFLSKDVAADVVGAAAIVGAAVLPIAYWIYSAPAEMNGAQRRARRVHGAVCLLRIALALLFVYVGIIKIPGRLHPMWVRMFERIGLGQWFRYVTALVEMAGGMLLVVPAATFVSVFLLGSAMIGALLAHIFILGIGSQTVVVVLLLAGLLTIARHERSLPISFCRTARPANRPESSRRSDP